MSVLLALRGRPEQCQSTHYFECPCFFGLRFQPYRKRLLKVIETWKKRQVEIVNRPEFHDRDDFVVNMQTFTKKVRFPDTKNGISDFTYMSADCFHFSQKGYAMGRLFNVNFY